MITVKNLVKDITTDDERKKRILYGINLHIDSGERVTIIGPSGAGKSTFLRCINLLEEFQEGDILLKDRSILSFPATELRKKVGMVFQHFNLFSHMTVKKNIMFAPVKLKVLNKKQANFKADELLEKIKLTERAKFYPNRLSGGEKQRVAIARAIAMNPDVLLVDEPTSALDPEMTSDIVSVLKSIAKDKTIISVTHDMNYAKNISTRLVFMENGQIIDDGSPVDIIENPRNERVKSFMSNAF